jgi:hypothetical protein
MTAEAEIGFTQRDELLVVLSKMWPSHLMYKADEDEADWPFILCIESTGGELFYHIALDRCKMFSHLSFRDNHWDGSGWDERTRRLNSI